MHKTTQVSAHNVHAKWFWPQNTFLRPRNLDMPYLDHFRYKHWTQHGPLPQNNPIDGVLNVRGVVNSILFSRKSERLLVFKRNNKNES